MTARRTRPHARFLIALLLVAAVSCAGIAAGTALSSDSGKGPLHRATTLLPGHEVRAPSNGASTSAIRGAKLRFYESNIMGVPPNGRLDGVMRCPRTFKVINGYFATDGFIFADTSVQAPTNLRTWIFGLQDLSGIQGQAYVGIVCLKGIAP